MGKSSRRTSGRSAPASQEGDLPVVGMREPCPCGSGKRYKACHGRRARAALGTLVSRPFEGLPGECDWVALREIVPAATATVSTVPAHGGREVTVVTVLPMAWPALHRADGTVLVALQTQFSSGDAGRDVAHALLTALETPPGTPVTGGVAPPGTPSLREVLDLTAGFEVTVHDGFDFWLGADADLTTEVQASMDRANASVVPTERLTSVEAAYWCSIGPKRHLRWVLPHPEDALLDALARLHVAGDLALTAEVRYVGAFRAAGLVAPVWDLPDGMSAEEAEKPAARFADRLDAALAVDRPLTPAERGARAGVVSRQLTLR